jgi:predicted transcriptional regulator
MATDVRMLLTSVLLPEETYARTQRMAEAHDVSTAWVIRHALLKFLGSREQQIELSVRLPKGEKASEV